MSITSEIEKLASLRERGDLSQAEFEKAKEILLAGKGSEAGPPSLPDAKSLHEKGKNKGIHLAIAICATVAAVLSGISVIIDPEPLQVVSLVIWTGLSIYWWIFYSRLKTEPGQ